MFVPRTVCCATLLIALTALPLAAQTAVSINPTALPAVTTIDKRFQSYNIEMLEVTGAGCPIHDDSFIVDMGGRQEAERAA